MRRLTAPQQRMDTAAAEAEAGLQGEPRRTPNPERGGAGGRATARVDLSVSSQPTPMSGSSSCSRRIQGTHGRCFHPCLRLPLHALAFAYAPIVPLPGSAPWAPVQETGERNEGGWWRASASAENGQGNVCPLKPPCTHLECHVQPGTRHGSAGQRERGQSLPRDQHVWGASSEGAGRAAGWRPCCCKAPCAVWDPTR